MKLIRSKTVGGILLIASAAADAATLQGLDADFLRDAGYFEAGPVRLYPALSTTYGYDDNLFESASRKQSTTFTRIDPELSAVLPLNTGYLQLGGQADDQRFMDSSDDNFTDRTLYGRASLEANSRNHFNFDLRYIKSHDARGTVLTEGFDPTLISTLDEPDEFTDKRAALKYEFGAAGAPGKLRFGTDYLEHDYDNHRERTQFFDREEYGASATFLWRVLPRTSLAFEGRERKIEYPVRDPSEPSLDNREHSLFLGAEWQGTAATSGSLRLGELRKDFDDPQRVDGTSFVWELNANWQPRTYSKVELKLERTPNATNGVGDFIDSKLTQVDWKHDWTPRIGTLLALSYTEQSYEHADRESKVKSAKLGFSYKMRRWLTWRLEGAWRDRTSNIETLEFERNRYWLTAEFTL